jgi:tetratricopeptide (TPR) repeat protein
VKEPPEIQNPSLPTTEVNSNSSSGTLRERLIEAEALGDIPKCIEICRTALAEGSRLSPDDNWYFGVKLVALLRTPESASSQDVDEAIAVMERLLAVLSRRDKPRWWAFLSSQLGAAILARKGDLNEALLHFENALEVITREKSPEEWALAKRAAGDVYYRLANSDSIAELTKSLEYYRDALTVFTAEKYPDEGLVETIDMIERAIARARAVSSQ